MSPQDAANAIATTVQAWTGGADPMALIRIAERESALHADAVGDRKFGAQVWAKQQERLRRDGNPWADRPERWVGSTGLFQLMSPYYLRLWDPKADPHRLFDPYVATVAAARLWNRAVEAGAKNFVEVRLFWGFGPAGLKYGPESEPYRKRLKSKWSVVDGRLNPPVSMYDYSSFGTGPQAGQEQRIADIRGGKITPFASKSALAKILVGLLAWRVFA